MKNFILITILILNLQSFAKANDIREFEIEGFSVGSSLLDHFTLNKIKSSVVDWYDDLEKNRYVAFAFDSPNFETYDFVVIWTKYNDEKYLIDTIAGVIYFGENKPIKSIENCYQEQKNIADELSQIFDEAEKIGPSTLKHSGDPSGQSSYTDIYLKIDNDYEVLVSCYDWSQEMMDKENKHDHIYVSIRSFELDDWLN